MAVILGDIIQCDYVYSLLGQTCRMVQFYEIENWDAGMVLRDIALQLNALHNAGIASVLSSQLQKTGLELLDVTNGLDFYILNTPGDTGAVGGQVMPPFVAWSFLQRRTSRVTRNGHKRVPGVPEASVADGVTVFSGTQLGFFKNLFSLSQNVPSETVMGASGNIQPVIIGRTLNLFGIPPTYELDLTKVNFVAGLEYRAVSSQNSRKFGRGE